jgi:hypothetical protein
LITFVEDAFKHMGFEKLSSQPSFQIKLKVMEDEMRFQIAKTKNNFSANGASSNGADFGTVEKKGWN